VVVGVTARAYQTRPAVQTLQEAGPWLGVRDDLSPNVASDKWLRALQNGYVVHEDIGPAIEGRPGFAQMGSQLGSSGKRTGLRAYQFTTRAGVQYTVAIVGGQFYTYNWSTDVWTEVVTVANLTSASITLSETAPVYCVTFADKLIVSDGVNVPWAWSGASGAGGLTKLTYCPVLFGQPVVYYAKLFGIKSTERSTIVWSEEADPNVGYEATISGRVYNNAWTVGQTDQNTLFALAATNRAMYLFRARSITEISGAVADDFRTTGTLPAVSSVVGCQSPGGVVVVDEDIWFWSSDNQPRVIRAGGGLAPESNAMGQTVRYSPLSTAALANVRAVYVDYASVVLFGFPESGSTVPTAYLAMSTNTGAYVGLWRGWQCTTLDIVRDGNGTPRMMHLGGSTAGASADGYAYVHGRPELSLWSDALQGGSQVIAHALTTGYLLWDAAEEHRLDRLTVSFLTTTGLTNCGATVTTPSGVSAVQAFAVVSSGTALWDQVTWDNFVWAGASSELRADLGRADEGRWLVVQLTHGTLTERWTINRLRLEAFRRDARPDIN